MADQENDEDIWDSWEDMAESGVRKQHNLNTYCVVINTLFLKYNSCFRKEICVLRAQVLLGFNIMLERKMENVTVCVLLLSVDRAFIFLVFHRNWKGEWKKENGNT